MTCRCKQTNPTGRDLCRFCTPTSVWWNRNETCWLWHCSNPAMKTDPPEWAFGNTRRATVGDSPAGAILPDADYIAVRSCFCRCERCPHFARGSKPPAGAAGLSM